MNRKELIKKYIEFFKSKDHKEIKNSSLIPENDPTVLFTTAGMHPIVPFLLGEKHPQGKKLVNVQRCIRTGDIDEVGDAYHHTFFEMLGNWSLGDYFKEDAIKMSFEFLTKELNIPIDRLAVTVFGGDKREHQVPKDKEAADIWKSLGIPEKRIAYLKGGIYESKNNWWGPAGKTGPCGPDTEMFFWKSDEAPAPEEFNPDDERWLEIWNDVLMQYNKDEKGNYNEAKQKNIDTGMGVERTLAVLNEFDDNYLTEIWQPIIKKIEKISNVEYNSNNTENKGTMRIIADHIKAAVFIIADGITPSNSEQGYVLRRLIRRAIREAKFNPDSDIKIDNFTKKVAEPVFEIYDDYEILKKNKEKILKELEKEEKNFLKTIEQGEKILKKTIKQLQDKKNNIIDGKTAFLLYQSYGFPLELTKEIASTYNISVAEEDFEQENKKHQDLSRTAAEGKFKSGLADNSEATTRLHTATHLLNEALRIVLKNPEIHQKGSNITPERLRFDFNFDRKLTPEELKAIEDKVNEIIQKNLDVKLEEMTVEEAKKAGAQGVFDSKYSEKIKVYSVGNFSKEICAGPHVSNTSELGHFKIKKEESSSAGVRRIKAVLE